MPIYKNITTSELYLEREDGLIPMKKIEINGLFQGSQSFYGKYVGDPNYLLERITDGLSLEGQDITIGINQFISINTGYSINSNSMLATSTDVARHPLVLVLGQYYSAWGSFDYTAVGPINVHVEFSIQGCGDHGAAGEATFIINSNPPAPNPLVTPAGSRIDCTQGLIYFSTNGPVVTGTKITSEIVFDNSAQGSRFSLAGTNPLVNYPSYTTRFTYVNAADISEFYVLASINQVKTMKVFMTGAKVGDPAKLTIYYYQFANNVPCQPTHTISIDSFVEATDLL